MPRQLSRFLIMFLGFLQTLTPLAHAHAGKNAAFPGLHIPGLESLHYSHNAPVLTNVNSEREMEGLLVMVATGIKSSQTDLVITPENPLEGLIVSQVQLSFLPENDQNFSPHRTRTYPRTNPFLPQSPRAPPVQ